MFAIVQGLLNEFACRECSLTIATGEGQPSLLLLLSGASLKYHDSSDFTLEELILTIVNPLPAKNDPEAKMSLLVERMRLKIGSLFLNRLFLKFEPEFQKHSISMVRAFFIKDRIVLRAVYHKGIDIPISVELSFSASKSSIRVDISGLQLSDFIPIPNLITKLLISLAKKYVDSSSVVVEDEFITVHLESLCPVPLSIQLTDARLEGEMLIIESM